MMFAAALAAVIVSALALPPGINIEAHNPVNATIWGLLVIVNTVTP